MPIEFTPEITENFYNRLAKRISDRGSQRQGLARGQALERGLTGDPWEASAVGVAGNQTSQELADLDAKLSYDVAGLGREERLGQERRGYQVEDRDFAAAEDEKRRAFEERLMNRQGDMENTRNRRNLQSSLWQLPGQIGGMVLGGWAGSGARGFGRT